MSLAVGTILRVVCTLVHTDTSIMQNVFNAVIGGSGGPFDEQDVTDDMQEWIDNIYDEFDSLLADTLTPTEVTVYEYDSVDDDWDEVGTATPTFTPIASGHILPRGVALLINAKTLDPDVNGKKYFGGITEAHWDDGAWNSSVLAAMAAAALVWGTSFVGTTTSGTFNPVIWSPTGTVAKVMTNVFSIPTIAAYQRRRKPGVGV